MNIHPLNDIDGYKAKNKPEAILMNALRFTEEDLTANQQAKMSVSQRLRCLTNRDGWLVAGLFCGFGFLAIWLGARDAVFFLVVFAAGIFACGQHVYNYHTDATKGIVAALEGRINLDIFGRRFSIEIDGMRFNLKRDTFLAFKNGDPYRIYYSPKSKMLLSAEWLRD